MEQALEAVREELEQLIRLRYERRFNRFEQARYAELAALEERLLAAADITAGYTG